MCNFGQAYEMSMIGQMIFGIRHNDTRKKIMASGLTWAQVKSIALDEDTQRTQMRSIAQAHLQAQSRNVNAVNAQQAQRAPQQPKPQPQPEPPAQDTHANGGNAKTFGPCMRCGRLHNVNKCRAIHWTCKICHKKGHIAKVCQSKNSQGNKPPEGVKQVIVTGNNPPPPADSSVLSVNIQLPSPQPNVLVVNSNAAQSSPSLVRRLTVATKLPVTCEKVAVDTAADPVLSIVFKYVHLGWPPKGALKNHPVATKLPVTCEKVAVDTAADPVLSIVFKVIIPTCLRKDVLLQIHAGHPGIVRSLMLARSYCWWPKMDEDISNLVSN
ncbi:uncharacterized protein LOC127752012, partial [Frankliniella occidentalis]|uniref:RNA-directed DNA polymerase n=1 Tax=Frankliniella occidentalis TaxID=133901 RepID=A0A9C6XV17_FRAOC